MPQKRKDDSKERMFKIVMNAQDGFEGKDDVKVGVNGKVFQIKRGYEVIVPESVFNVIRDAKYTITSRDDNGAEDVRDVPRFSYTYLGEVFNHDPDSDEDLKEAGNDA